MPDASATPAAAATTASRTQLLSHRAVAPSDSRIDKWLHLHGATAVRVLLLLAVLIPVIVSVVAAVITALSAAPAVGAGSARGGSTASAWMITLVSTMIRSAVVALLVLINIVVGLLLVQLARGRILPWLVGWPVMLIAGAGMLIVDGDLLGLTGALYATGPDATRGWIGVSILGGLFLLLGSVLSAWLGIHLMKMLLQPRVWATFIRHRLAMISFGILCLLVVAAFTYPLIDPDGTRYNEMHDDMKYAKPMSSGLLMGGDDLGRDVAMRLWRGARVSLAVGMIASLISALIGLVIGAIAGYYGDLIDTLLMRFLDMMLSIPVIAVMVILAAIKLPEMVSRALKWEHAEFLGLDLSIWNIVLIVVLFGWMTVARLVRGEVLKQKEEVYVEAARAAGLSNTRILWGHIIPNCMGPLIVATTLSIGSIILYESALSYLGLGIQPPEVSWGKMVDDGRRSMGSEPHLVLLPGLAILLTVVSFNFLGDGLRDALDPRHVSQGRASGAGDGGGDKDGDDGKPGEQPSQPFAHAVPDRPERPSSSSKG